MQVVPGFCISISYISFQKIPDGPVRLPQIGRLTFVGINVTLKEANHES